MSAVDELIETAARVAGEKVAARLLADIEQHVERAVDRVLERRQAGDTIGTDGLAELLGVRSRQGSRDSDPATAALRRAQRDKELLALAVTGGKGARWTWRRHEVVALLARRRAERIAARSRGA